MSFAYRQEIESESLSHTFLGGTLNIAIFVLLTLVLVKCSPKAVQDHHILYCSA